MKLALLLFAIGLAGILHQKLIGGGWFNLEQVLHHELFIIVAFALGLALLLRR